MKHVYFFLIVLLATSCIPIRIAPTIKEHKIVRANKFKRKLPKQYAFIFEDPKEANEFYNYINTKFQLKHHAVDWDIPFIVENQYHYLRWYETDIPNKTLNLIPFFIDAKLQSDGKAALFEDLHVSRKGNWYLVLTVNSDESIDCLHPDYKHNKEVTAYLKNLREEYINTHIYSEVLLKQKSPN